MLYMVSYFLNTPEYNRESVEYDIKALGPWCNYVPGTYLINTDKDTGFVHSACVQHLTANDSMVVAETQKPLGGWLKKDQWDWINLHL